MASVQDFTPSDKGTDADLTSWSDLLDADMSSLDELLKDGLDWPTSEMTMTTSIPSHDVLFLPNEGLFTTEREIAAEMTIPRDFPLAPDEGICSLSSSLLDFGSGNEAEDKEVDPLDMVKFNSPERRPRDINEWCPDEMLARENATKGPGECEAWTTLQSNLKQEVIREIERLISESGRDKVRQLTETAEEILRKVSSYQMHVPENRANASHLSFIEEALRMDLESLQTLLECPVDLALPLRTMFQLVKDGLSLVNKLGKIKAFISAKLGTLVRGLKFREDMVDKLFLKCSSNIPALVDSFLEKQSVNFVSVDSKAQERPQKTCSLPVITEESTMSSPSKRARMPRCLTWNVKYDDCLPVCGGPIKHSSNSNAPAEFFPDIFLPGEDGACGLDVGEKSGGIQEDSRGQYLNLHEGTDHQQIAQKEPRGRLNRTNPSQTSFARLRGWSTWDAEYDELLPVRRDRMKLTCNGTARFFPDIFLPGKDDAGGLDVGENSGGIQDDPRGQYLNLCEGTDQLQIAQEEPRGRMNRTNPSQTSASTRSRSSTERPSRLSANCSTVMIGDNRNGYFPMPNCFPKQSPSHPAGRRFERTPERVGGSSDPTRRRSTSTSVAARLNRPEIYVGSLNELNPLQRIGKVCKGILKSKTREIWFWLKPGKLLRNFGCGSPGHS